MQEGRPRFVVMGRSQLLPPAATTAPVALEVQEEEGGQGVAGTCGQHLLRARHQGLGWVHSQERYTLRKVDLLHTQTLEWHMAFVPNCSICICYPLVVHDSTRA